MQPTYIYDGHEYRELLTDRDRAKFPNTADNRYCIRRPVNIRSCWFVYWHTPEEYAQVFNDLTRAS